MAPGFGVFSVAMRDFAQNTPRCEWTLAKPKALETLFNPRGNPDRE